ncbi:LysR substrate-binding domain-containing protein [Hoeflea sp. TYP-13]|uniref:LysR substrate-binding domain-containing protein n=1 Tax=Hoeflea sp. TYP-13 TaxID=3230023 RepID=UPI0034C5F4BF
MKHTPHLSYVRSFEAAARHLSFTAAAEELNYTQSAISNHVRSLEDFIGRPLFIRYSRSLALTELGVAYLASVRQALKQIDAATEAIISGTHKKSVVVSCPISLSENWLPGRIREFQALHPDIEITVHGTIWTDVEPEVADIRLTINHQDDAPAGVVPLWAEKLAVVCAPDYKVAGKRLAEPRQLQEADLIHVLGRPVHWQSIAAEFNLKSINSDGGIKTNSTAIALELASQGLGCAAVPNSLVGIYLARNLLVVPFELNIESPWLYYLSDETPSMSQPAKTFRNWLQKNITT